MSDLLVVRESGPSTLTVVDDDLGRDDAADVADRARRDHPGQDVEVVSSGVLEMMALTGGYTVE